MGQARVPLLGTAVVVAALALGCSGSKDEGFHDVGGADLDALTADVDGDEPDPPDPCAKPAQSRFVVSTSPGDRTEAGLGRVTGVLALLEHPEHLAQAHLVLGGTTEVAIDGQGAFEVMVPAGPVELTFSHPFYETLEHGFSLLEGEQAHVTIELLYLGKAFPVGTLSTRIVGHACGAMGSSKVLAGTPNTIAACGYARGLGVGFLEIDTLLSRDGVPFAGHDWNNTVTPTLGEEVGNADVLVSLGYDLTSAFFDRHRFLILDMIHNHPSLGAKEGDLEGLVDYLDTHYPDRIRDDVYLQVFRDEEYEYIRQKDPCINVSYNLASWSAWGVWPWTWRDRLESVVGETDMWVLNPATDITAGTLSYLDANGLANHLVPVVAGKDWAEVARLVGAASALGLEVAPMVEDVGEFPEEFPIIGFEACLPDDPILSYDYASTGPVIQDTGSGHSYPGHVTGNPTSSAGPHGPGSAIQLATGDGVELHGSDVEHLNGALGQAVTLSTWVRLEDAGGIGFIAGGSVPDGQRYILAFAAYAGSAHGFLKDDTGLQKEFVIGDLSDGAWHHLALTFDGSMGLAYFDGIGRQFLELAPVDQPGEIGQMTTFTLGWDPHDPSRGLQGSISETRLFDRTLRGDELWFLFLDENPTACAPPGSQGRQG